MLAKRGILYQALFLNMDRTLTSLFLVKREQHKHSLSQVLDNYTKFVKPGFEDFVLPVSFTIQRLEM
jgi:uridine kinase